MENDRETQASPLLLSFREADCQSGVRLLHDLAPVDPVLEFARHAAAGLASRPRRLDSRFLYDAQGSELFEEITRQPEYYLTRTEASILSSQARRIRAATGPVALSELGAGSAVKTDHLLRAWVEAAQDGSLRDGVHYVPIDVSESALRSACAAIAHDHPAVRITALHTEYQRAFPLLRELSPVLVLFLGSTIGNFSSPAMDPFLASLAAALRPGDFFLVGLDLVKERSVLEAAYNDAAGVTQRFTRNIFARMNRDLGSAIDLSHVEHVARYDAEREQIEIGARFTRRQTFYLAPVGRWFTITRGEMVQTEISRKFRIETFTPYLERYGFAMHEVFTDERRWFALLLLRRTAEHVDTTKGRRG